MNWSGPNGGRGRSITDRYEMFSRNPEDRKLPFATGITFFQGLEEEQPETAAILDLRCSQVPRTVGPEFPLAYACYIAKVRQAKIRLEIYGERTISKRDKRIQLIIGSMLRKKAIFDWEGRRFRSNPGGLGRMCK